MNERKKRESQATRRKVDRARASLPSNGQVVASLRRLIKAGAPSLRIRREATKLSKADLCRAGSKPRREVRARSRLGLN